MISYYITELQYTRSPLQDSCFFGPSPWKILATTYEKRNMSNPAPGENLLSGNLVLETGCRIIIVVIIVIAVAIIIIVVTIIAITTSVITIITIVTISVLTIVTITIIIIIAVTKS